MPARRLLVPCTALACGVGLLCSAGCGAAEKKVCGLPVETLHPGTSTPYTLHLTEGQARVIITDHGWYQPETTPGNLDPAHGTLTVSPNGHTVTFTDSHHRTVTFVEHRGTPACAI